MRQRGFSLVPALFLMIVLAALGAVAVRLLAVSQQTTVLAVQGTRAYAAARAGVDYAIYDALLSGNCGSQSLVLSEAGLAGFSVDTNCAGAYGSPDYVSRRIRTTVTDAS